MCPQLLTQSPHITGAPETDFSSPFPLPPFGKKPKCVQSLPQVGPNIPSPLYLPLLPNRVLSFKQAAPGLHACIFLPPCPPLLSFLFALFSLHAPCSSAPLLLQTLASFSPTLPGLLAPSRPTPLSLGSPLVASTMPPILWCCLNHGFLISGSK